MVPVNYLVVLVAAIISMPLGFLWYGPFFGKPWTRMMGMTKEKMEAAKKKGMTMQYVIMFVGALVMSFVLSHAVIFANAYLHTNGMFGGIMTGFMSWLGFIVPISLGSVLWEGKPWRLWMINAGYYLVLLLVMGVTLSLW
jgi:hypothetical protein